MFFKNIGFILLVLVFTSTPNTLSAKNFEIDYFISTDKGENLNETAFDSSKSSYENKADIPENIIEPSTWSFFNLDDITCNDGSYRGSFNLILSLSYENPNFLVAFHNKQFLKDILFPFHSFF